MHSSNPQFRRVVPFVLCLLLAHTAHAQVAVRGEITDAATSRPLAFAEVTVAETDRSVAAGANGAYTLSNLAPGSYTLTVSSVGYRPQEKTVDVSAGSAATLDFALEAVGVTEEVVVTGYRAAAANALQDKRMSAMINSVVS